MLPRRIVLYGLLFGVFSLNALGQNSASRFEALKQALGLSDSQMSQLQHRNPTIDRRQAMEAARLRGSMLDDSQRTMLTAIEKVLGHWDAAALSIRLGLVNELQWPGGSLCLSYPIRTYALYPYASDLGITSSQEEQFEQIERDAVKPLWIQAREMAVQLLELLNSGVSSNSPEAVQLGLAIDKLQGQMNARLPYDLALSVLNATQRGKLATFETELQLASEGIELGLIPAPSKGEILCH